MTQLLNEERHSDGSFDEDVCSCTGTEVVKKTDSSFGMF